MTSLSTIPQTGRYGAETILHALCFVPSVEMDVSGDVTIRRVVRAVSLLFVLASLVVTCTVPVSAGGPGSAPEQKTWLPNALRLWTCGTDWVACQPNDLIGWLAIHASTSGSVSSARRRRQLRKSHDGGDRDTAVSVMVEGSASFE